MLISSLHCELEIVPIFSVELAPRQRSATGVESRRKILSSAQCRGSYFLQLTELTCLICCDSWCQLDVIHSSANDVRAEKILYNTNISKKTYLLSQTLYAGANTLFSCSWKEIDVIRNRLLIKHNLLGRKSRNSDMRRSIAMTVVLNPHCTSKSSGRILKLQILKTHSRYYDEDSWDVAKTKVFFKHPG